MPAGLVAVDTQLAITSMNAEAGRILGLQAGDRPESLPDGMAGLAGEIGESGESGAAVVREIACRVRESRELLLDISASPIRDDGGRISGYLFLFRDLTEIRALKEEVDRSRRLAAVGKLAAGVAHEIRNPLSSIKGFATWFRERYRHLEEDRSIADVMIGEVERLNRSVTQLLEFARPVPRDLRPVHVREIIAHSLMLVEHDLKAAGIGAQTEVKTRRETMTADPDLLKQILLNLYLNAVQAMESGGRLTVTVSDGDREDTVLIEVADTGRGIDPGDLDRIFDPYFTTRPGGTGLGLAMVHRAVEALGGDIRVESTPGEGSRFTLRLPC
jgi:two-component system sensor histidine kinase HydH